LPHDSVQGRPDQGQGALSDLMAQRAFGRKRGFALFGVAFNRGLAGRDQEQAKGKQSSYV